LPISLVIELWRFMCVRKKNRPMPALIMMCVSGDAVVVTQGRAVIPFSATLFKFQPSSARISRTTGIGTLRLAAR
jgi:hypothetical protein